MKKTINTSKLKIKYIIGSYRDADDFPTSEDILYELIKDWSVKGAKDLIFTDVSLKTTYSLSDKQFNGFINKMIKSNIIEIVKQKEDITTYKIKTNIFE